VEAELHWLLSGFLQGLASAASVFGLAKAMTAEPSSRVRVREGCIAFIFMGCWHFNDREFGNPLQEKISPMMFDPCQRKRGRPAGGDWPLANGYEKITAVVSSTLPESSPAPRRTFLLPGGFCGFE